MLPGARNGAPAPRDVQLLQSRLHLEEFQLLQRAHHAVHLLVQPVPDLLHGELWREEPDIGSASPGEQENFGQRAGEPG